MDKLTNKQKKFCEYFVLGGVDKFTALDLAGYEFNCEKDVDNRTNRNHTLKRLFSNVTIRNYINDLRGTQDEVETVERSYVIEKLKSMAETAENDSCKLKAIELLGKTLGMFSDKQVFEEVGNPADIARDAFNIRQMKLVNGDEEEDGNS